MKNKIKAYIGALFILSWFGIAGIGFLLVAVLVRFIFCWLFSIDFD